MKNKRLNLYFLVMLLLFMLQGCGGGGGTQAVATPSVTLTADKTQAIASTTDNVTLTATVRDGNGSPLAGQTIDFNVPPGTYPYLSLGHTNLNGTAVIHLSYPPIGPNGSAVLAVTATSGEITSNEVTITFANPQQAPAAVTLTANKTSFTADGIDKVTFTATATDANGSPSVGQAFVLNVPAGPYTGGINFFTDNSGQATAILKTIARQTGMVGSVSISVTATISGVISNVIDVTVAPP